MKKIILLLILAFLVVDFTWAQGCSQCRMLSEQGAESELNRDSFGSNINTGILYLMAVPYLLLMFFFRKRIIGFVKGLRKAKTA